VSGEKKPKEFWIQDRYLHYEADTEKILDDDIHVIEYSAYEQLKAENNRLVYELDKSRSDRMTKYEQLKSKLEIAKKGLEFYANGSNWQNFDLEHEADPECEADYEHLNPERPRLITGGKKARQALKEIEG